MKSETQTLFRHIGLSLLSLIIMIPILWMLGISFKPPHDSERFSIIPRRIHVLNYAIVMGRTSDAYTNKPVSLNFRRCLANSALVAAWVAILQVTTSALAAYAFSRLQWYGRDSIFFLYLATMMIPGVVLILPTYQIMVHLGWVNTYIGLIIPLIISPVGTFLLRQFMLTIPLSIDEAAELDGAGHLEIFLDMILPMTWPALVTLAILVFISNFQSFFWPFIMIKNPSLYTLPVGLLAFQQQSGPEVELLMAATLMTVAPLLFLFIIFQKQIIAGIHLGDFKN